MITACIVCKSEFEVPSEHVSRTVLLTCPACGFIGLWDAESYSIPTYQEEASLERVEGTPLEEQAHADAGEATVVDQFAPDLPLPYKRRLFLKILTGSKKGTMVPFTTGRMLIGRADADVALDDPKVSRKHSAIEAISRENIFLRDLASTNGTFLNGTRIHSKKLRSGDVVRIGNTEMQFLWQDED